MWLQIKKGLQHKEFLRHFGSGQIVEFLCGKVRELDELILNKSAKKCQKCTDYYRNKKHTQEVL